MCFFEDLKGTVMLQSALILKFLKMSREINPHSQSATHLLLNLIAIDWPAVTSVHSTATATYCNTIAKSKVRSPIGVNSYYCFSSNTHFILKPRAVLT